MTTVNEKPSIGPTREDFKHIDVINIKGNQFVVLAIPTAENNNTTAVTFHTTASKQDTEGWRLERLTDVAQWITNDIWKHHYNDIAFIELHDHKGMLTSKVTTSKRFKRHYKQAIETVVRTSWACATEPEANTTISFTK